MFRRESSPARFHSTPTLIAFVTAVLILSTAALAQTESVLYAFQGSTDGGEPQAGLIADKYGNLYGTAQFGGSTGANCENRFHDFPGGCGTVFELVKPAQSGGAWTQKTLYEFQGGSDGAYPLASLAFDAAGNLYGTTGYGGAGSCTFDDIPSGCGTVFQLTPPSTAGAPWTETVLHIFPAIPGDGRLPEGGVVLDAAGNLYGTTFDGGNPKSICESCGIVFRLSPPSTKGEAWTETILYKFKGNIFTKTQTIYDGANPFGNLTLNAYDGKFHLFGTTAQGGSKCDNYGFDESTCGTVFEITPPATTGAWVESVIYSAPTFTSPGLSVDKTGNLYGVTFYGGPSTTCVAKYGYYYGCGAVYQLTPPTAPGGTWGANTIYNLTGDSDGGWPVSVPVVDANGIVYGTTPAWATVCNDYAYVGGGCGAAYELQPPSSPGGTWTETSLHQFTGDIDGAVPQANLFLGADGIYGTTTYGGSLNSGTVFKIVP
jgi:uncharacterized protein YceK